MNDRRSLAFAALSLAWLLALQLVGVSDAFAYLAPAVLIFLPLLGGRYPGDEALVRAVARRTAARWRPGVAARPSTRRRPGALLPRGGRLVGAALAGRAPPVSVEV
jgi:uncharacterized SAM-binding protein YcdF (DUF218 family)